MDLETQSVQFNKSQTIEKIRRDYNFMKFSLLPELTDYKNDLRWMSSKVGATLDEALSYQEELLAVGLWKKDATGSITTTEKFVDYFPEQDSHKKVLGFLTTNAQVASTVTHEGPCWYEYSTVVTTDELRKEFIGNVWKAYQDFLTKSQQAKGTQMVTWSHMFTDALAVSSQEEQK